MSRNHQIYFLCCLFALIGCSDTQETFSEPVVRPAKLIEVEAASSNLDLSFPAVIRAIQSAELTFQVSGEIRELAIIEGSEVEAGDLIARLDQRSAENAVAQAQAEYDNAESEFQRAEQLIQQSLISQSNFDTLRTQRDVTAIALSNAEKALSDTEIHAPFTGSISRLYVNQFQNIQAKEPIVVIQSAEVEAIINVPSAIIAIAPQIEPTNTRVLLDQAPDQPIPGEFREFSGVADQGTQTYEASFSFTPPEELLILPGMTATLSTTLMMIGGEEHDAGVSVPLSSVLADGSGTSVWLVNEDMSISKLAVTVDTEPGPYVRITSGLSGGETIVSAGVSFLHEGMIVRPWTPE